MVDDKVLPHPSSVLAATISVTFVGPKNLPQKAMCRFLCVHRMWVRMDLKWLVNNAVYQGHLELKKKPLSAPMLKEVRLL